MLLHGDCLDVLKSLPDASVDACVTDPPYGLKFMGKHWDHGVPSADVWREVLRVLKPGGHLLAFAGTRTQHRMASAIEDAGLEIRDMIAWVYGSGFPKSHDVAKAAHAHHQLGGSSPRKRRQAEMGEDYIEGETAGKIGVERAQQRVRAPKRPMPKSQLCTAARQWQGWGTALKPALEPITVARKPLIGTVAENVLAHGTGGLNIDGCRVAHDEECRMMAPSPANIDNPSEKHRQAGRRTAVLELKPEGRWPANLIHDGSEEVLAAFPQAKSGGNVKGTEPSNVTAGIYGEFDGRVPFNGYGDAGSAARFFYCAKASKRDRDEGNNHPTVKPTGLMRYLVRLVTPQGGVVLDPFMGSGSTGKACALEGFDFIGIEREAEYVEIARARIAAARVDQLSLL